MTGEGATGAVTGGRCLCGAVRFRFSGGPRSRNHCHCESCRRATSAAFATWPTVDRAALAWEGEVAAFASSPGVTRRFCPACGSPLACGTAERPDDADLYAASLDDSSGHRADSHANWAERVPWVALADDLPRR